ncbi:MAG: thioredoxin family protein [Actinomycetota bacterium]
MEIRIRYIDGCANRRMAEERVREVLHAVGGDDPAHVILERVESDDAAQRLGLQGSPTILIDGADPFAMEGAAFGLTRRVYRTEAGLEGSPSLAQLRSVLAA